jgi:HEPN domain-containing protein
MCRIPGTLPRAAVLDGITVYEKAPAIMAEPDPADVRNSVQGWLRIARSDMQVAHLCLGTDEPERGIAAYHCQQAAEKVLKGYLVLAGIDFGKTHDLDGLGASVTAAFPGDELLVRPLRAWTNWAVAYRYPDEPSPPPEPSAGELAVALEQIARLASALEAKVRAAAEG